MFLSVGCSQRAKFRRRNGLRAQRHGTGGTGFMADIPLTPGALSPVYCECTGGRGRGASWAGEERSMPGGRGSVALSVALERQGLDAPGAEDNAVLSYASGQVANAGQRADAEALETDLNESNGPEGTDI